MIKRYCDICEREVSNLDQRDKPRYQIRVSIVEACLKNNESAYYGDMDLCPDCNETIAKAIFDKANEIRRSFPNLKKTIEEKIDAVVSAVELELSVGTMYCRGESGCNNAGECACEKS